MQLQIKLLSNIIAIIPIKMAEEENTLVFLMKTKTLIPHKLYAVPRL